MGHQCLSCCRRHWSLEEIPYPSIDREQVNANRDLFYLLASASFVEITSDLYTRALLDYFLEDAEVRHWLETHWRREELQHGMALKQYVNSVWPDFNWERAYRRFYCEYSRLCKTERLGPTPALELVSRCVVETGTATLYTMLHRVSNEPALRILTARIRSDEARHYKQFYQYFLRYRALERSPGRYSVLRTLVSRIAEIDNEDAYYAFKHVFQERHPRQHYSDSDYKAFRRRCCALARYHYPYKTAVKMFLKPLGLNPSVRHAIVPLLSTGAKCLCGRRDPESSSIRELGFETYRHHGQP